MQRIVVVDSFVNIVVSFLIFVLVMVVVVVVVVVVAAAAATAAANHKILHRPICFLVSLCLMITSPGGQ